ncbi:MAG: PH domain-containing protein [Candidatus Aenigmatarchaeota archaeon]|nr:PH domain-containing protein [Candidatus Aenigmarchaeota archaeon]
MAFYFTIGSALYSALVYKNVFYGITNKRVTIQNGLKGIDFNIIDYDQITNASVNVDLIDKLFGSNSGSITIYTPSIVQISRGGIFSSSRVPMSITTPYAIRHIDNPYEVFKFFKKVSHDVKKDIEFPNKYRTDRNPGYKTGYKPSKKLE